MRLRFGGNFCILITQDELVSNLRTIFIPLDLCVLGTINIGITAVKIYIPTGGSAVTTTATSVTMMGFVYNFKSAKGKFLRSEDKTVVFSDVIFLAATSRRVGEFSTFVRPKTDRMTLAKTFLRRHFRIK